MEAFHSDDLFPFTATRLLPEIRIGILTLREKWRRYFPGMTDAEINEGPAGFPVNVLPTQALMEGRGEAWKEKALYLTHPWDLFRLNAVALADDFALLTRGRRSAPLPSFVQAINPESIFVEEGATLFPCILNASAGPVYIGKNAEIMEGSLIRGPFAACEGAVVKMGTRIYGATTLGPYSVVGGEVKNSILFGYSNKGHDGYLGDAVIGEWCNLGAGTSNSNLKNNAGEVKVWDQRSGKLIPAGTKCGLLMGDYSRCAINTSFNTGTVVGICCNIFGEGLTPKFIPSFSWGHRGSSKYELEKSLRDIANWKKLKNQQLTEAEIRDIQAIFEKS